MSVLAVEPSYELHLAHVPAFEPPYDDEAGGDSAGFGAGAMPLPFGPRRLALVPPLTGRTATARADDDTFFGPQRTTTAVLPEVSAWSHRFVQVLLETVEGRRGVTQVAKFVSPALGADIERKSSIRARMAAARTAGQPVVVRSVRVCELEDGIAEVSAVVRRGARTLAVALRLEGIDGRWMCTALQM
ncbi:MAG: hypothetical protein QOG52_2974 [Frankiaceae bacterium]|nr:hypothetical protein [Frankiaceae bacterium]